MILQKNNCSQEIGNFGKEQITPNSRVELLPSLSFPAKKSLEINSGDLGGYTPTYLYIHYIAQPFHKMQIAFIDNFISI